MDVSKDDLKIAFEKTNINGIRRGETLSIEEFAHLANTIYEITSNK